MPMPASEAKGVRAARGGSWLGLPLDGARAFLLSKSLTFLQLSDSFDCMLNVELSKLPRGHFSWYKHKYLPTYLMVRSLSYSTYCTYIRTYDTFNRLN